MMFLIGSGFQALAGEIVHDTGDEPDQEQAPQHRLGLNNALTFE